MSLTTVAATIQPDEELARLPASHPDRFQPSDFIAAGLVFFVTLGVYIATLAPNVTLEDSGELITAAATLGVGHPPGYPLWTMLGFAISHLLPFGNMAWKINLLSALFGATSNAVLTLLVCHSGRWLLQRWTPAEEQPVARRFCFYAGLFAGLTIGFSEVMWSQAVISAVHGTLNALFMNLVLILFYFWMIAPEKKYRLILAVFVFALGLSNHHTLIQIIPAFLIAAFLVSFFLRRIGLFWSVFLAVNLFSLSILVYISWLSGDEQLQTITQVMARLVLIATAATAFFYMKQFRAHLFLLGVATAVVIFAYGYYLMGPDKDEVNNFFHTDVGDTRLDPALDNGKAFEATDQTATLRNPINGWQFWNWGTFKTSGWLQGRVANARADAPMQLDSQPLPKRPVNLFYGFVMLALAALALGLLYTSTLDRRLIIGVFIAGWIGLIPYAYEPFAANTHPTINWGYAADREGFFYEVSRVQYPKALPVLIKSTFGKIIGVVPKDAVLDPTIGQPKYFERLGLSFYFYGDSLQSNFTVPLIFLTLAVLTYFRRFDWPQINWFIFLGCAFFFVGFMLILIAPQDGFDFQRNLSNKVFHLQSHCIFVILMSYGALAGMTFLNSAMPEILPKAGIAGFGIPLLCLSLLPLWSNFDRCSQAGHWFGYDFGADILRPLEKNAVYLGGSDPGRFVPTYMVFVESQQPDRWKREPGFDRRDITVITQNALCDSHYNAYIRDQYDPRYRPDPAASGPVVINTPDGPRPGAYTPFEKWLGRDHAYPVKPVTCESDAELLKIWNDYRNRPDVAPRIGPDGVLRTTMDDVNNVNGLVTKDIFEKNKKDHAFYIEQCVPMEWMYPYLLPSGLILKINPDSMTAAQFAAKVDVEADRKFWDAYSQRLLSDPKFRVDDDATLSFSRLAYWHADLYRYRQMDKDEEYWLKLSLALCPQLPEAVNEYTSLLIRQQRFDEAAAVAKQALDSDPFSDDFNDRVDDVAAERMFDHREIDIRAQLASSPYDVDLNLNLARVLQSEGKFKDVDDRLRMVAGMTNWTDEAIGNVLGYYVSAHNYDAASAFLEARAQIDPKDGKLLYALATMKAQLNLPDDAIRYLTQAIQDDPTAINSARVDLRFGSLHNDPRFITLVTPNAPPATNAAPTTNAPPVTGPVPLKIKSPTPPKPVKQ